MNISQSYQQQQQLPPQQMMSHDNAIQHMSMGPSNSNMTASQGLYALQYQQMQEQQQQQQHHQNNSSQHHNHSIHPQQHGSNSSPLTHLIQQQQQHPNQQQQPQAQQQQPSTENGFLSASLSSSQNWQQQIQLAQVSKQSNAPHNYARSAALQSRSNNLQNPALTITELAMQIVQQNHQAQKISAQTSPMTPVKGSNGAGPAFSLSYSGNNSKRELQEDERQRKLNEKSRQYWSALDLSGQGLLVFSPKITNYTFLQKLYLCHNKLTSIPGSITKLEQLRVLDISHNQITELPDGLGLLFNLKYLFLFDNKVQNLPNTFGFLFQLDFLGIEGNPLNEHIKTIIAQEGTKGLIADYRENSPVSPAAPPRNWLSFDEMGQLADKTPIPLPSDVNDVPVVQEEENSNKKDRFTLLTYNTLCQWYATPSMYGYTPSWALAWPYRSQIILKELIAYSSDIICLQEVDKHNFDVLWSPKLAQRGYKGLFGQKTRAKTMGESEAKNVDGCATFFRTSKFKLIETKTLEYASYAIQKDDLKKAADIFNRVMNKDNVAIISVFEHLGTGQIVILANTHFHWDPAFNDVKVVQGALLLEVVDSVALRYVKNPAFPQCSDTKTIPVIVNGDFNSTQDSGVYHLFSTGKIANHDDLSGRAYGKFTDEGISHNFSLQSAYADIGELPFTNFTPNFVALIDYIWHSTSALRVTGLLDKIDPDYVKNYVGAPNPHIPSDHIPIMAEFSIKKKKEITKLPPPNFGSSSRRA